MRSQYWSNTKFADKIRNLFGIKKQPTSATAEGWDEYETTAKQTSGIGYNIVESLNTIQTVVYWIPDKFKSASYFISNVKNRSHVLPTNVKFGSWGDLTSRIPDALMLSIIDFVEKECFWMNVAFYSERPQGMSDTVWKYNRQSYIQQKLFPVKVSDAERAKNGIEWLEFQIKSGSRNKRNNKSHPYRKLIAAYWFAKNRYGADLYDESGFTAAYDKTPGVQLFKSNPEKDIAFDKLREIEKEYDAQVILHCTNIVKYHGFLWT